MRLRVIIFVISALLPTMHSYCQKQHFTLNGRIHVANGATYPYQLVLNLTDTSFSGYTITRLQDGAEPQIAMKGYINRGKQALVFSEKKLVSELPPNFTMCLVSASLKYRSTGKAGFTGTFLSKDMDGKVCGKGTIDMEHNAVLERIFTAEPARSRKGDENAPAATKETGEIELTGGVNKHFDWYSDTCTFEIFDGGLIDGDEVTLIFNGKTLLSDYALTRQKKVLKLPLQKKTNTITIVAGYEGKVPPNTANIMISGGSMRYRLKSNTNAGEKATIIIDRK